MEGSAASDCKAATPQKVQLPTQLYSLQLQGHCNFLHQPISPTTMFFQLPCSQQHSVVAMLQLKQRPRASSSTSPLVPGLYFSSSTTITTEKCCLKPQTTGLGCFIPFSKPVSYSFYKPISCSFWKLAYHSQKLPALAQVSQEQDTGFRKAEALFSCLFHASFLKSCLLFCKPVRYLND